MSRSSQRESRKRRKSPKSEIVLDLDSKQPLHERWSEYTPEEIYQIKKEVCVAHSCPYASKIMWSGKHVGSNIHVTCNYLLMTKRCRECMPDVCKHWKDKGVKRPKNDNQTLFDNK